MKLLEANDIPKDRIVDGRVFQVPDLDISRLLKEGVAYGTFESKYNVACRTCIYPRVMGAKDMSTDKKSDKYFIMKIGRQSYLGKSVVEGGEFGSISIGDFSSIAWGVIFELNLNKTHNFGRVSQFALDFFSWELPRDMLLIRPPDLQYQIKIGSDVWIGRGCKLKCTNYKKPLVIGDGAIVAADSVVVKSVPPYAIVGGNPAQIIKYRFPPHVIKSLLKIKWWNWSLDKIHDNFNQFHDVEKFISLHRR